MEMVKAALVPAVIGALPIGVEPQLEPPPS